MTRQPPLLPLPWKPHLSFRSPPPPGIRTPCSGRNSKASCKERYSSSVRKALISRVKIGVSIKRIINHTPLAYRCQQAPNFRRDLVLHRRQYLPAGRQECRRYSLIPPTPFYQRGAGVDYLIFSSISSSSWILSRSSAARSNSSRLAASFISFLSF